MIAAISVLKFVISILSLFSALGLGCALWIGLRRDTTQPDPCRDAFGDVPETGFTAKQLLSFPNAPPAFDPCRRSFATRTIRDIRPSASLPPTRNAGGATSIIPSWRGAVRNFFKRLRHA